MLSKLQFNHVLLAVLYGVELLDELIYGLHGAVLPLLKDDLSLSYTQVGLLFTVPGLLATFGEPFIGLLGDTRYRRALVLAGILATAAGLLLTGLSRTFGLVLLAFSIMHIASGAYVTLGQATLIDRNPARAEHTMARWTVLGAVGVTLAPLLAAYTLEQGFGWRTLYLAFGGAAILYAPLLALNRFNYHSGAEESRVSPLQFARDLLAAFGQRELMRWIILTELADLMLDKLLEVTALYFHDVAGVSFAEASGAVGVLSAGWLVGGIVLVPLLEKVSGVRILRLTAFIVLALYVGFLLLPFVWLKFVLIGAIALGTSAWYPILRGKAYSVLPGRSGLNIAINSLATVLSLFVPVLIGQVADILGLSWAMWILVLGPLALIIGLPNGKG